MKTLTTLAVVTLSTLALTACFEDTQPSTAIAEKEADALVVPKAAEPVKEADTSKATKEKAVPVVAKDTLSEEDRKKGEAAAQKIADDYVAKIKAEEAAKAIK